MRSCLLVLLLGELRGGQLVEHLQRIPPTPAPCLLPRCNPTAVCGVMLQVSGCIHS